MTGRPWIPGDEDRAIAIFAQHTDYTAAFDQVRREVRDCTKSGLKERFRKCGKRAPRDYLRATAVPVAAPSTPAPQPYAAPVQALDFEDEETRRTDPVPPPAEALPRIEWLAPPPPPIAPFESFRFGILPDAHIPYHDERAWQAALRVLRFVQPTHLKVMGDCADFYCVSSHDRSPTRASRLKEELAVVAEKLDELDALGIENKHICLGNHEYRLDRYIGRRAPELFGLVGTTTAELLNLKERGWTWTNYGDEHHVGATRMSHEFGDCGVHALKRALEATRSDCAIGHTHLLGSLDAEHPATGRTITATSFGWLGSFKDIDYANRTKIMSRWRHGVGVGFGRADGTMRRECVRLTEGMPIVVDGQRA